MPNAITFSSCFYIIKSKFDPTQYVAWMNNMLSIVYHFNLVLYCDEHSYKYITIPEEHKGRIKVVIKPLDQFYNYKYKEQWILNHENNILLNERSSWELNMLWSEKIQFVQETFERNYFETTYYGWCDIGYFRNRYEDTHTTHLHDWCSNESWIEKMALSHICYACICNDDRVMNYLTKLINTVDATTNLPSKPIPPHQNSIAGGFFILHKNKIHWWATTYDTMLVRYFENKYLVKDDQIILANCILSKCNRDHFILFRENPQTTKKDNWFMFQRLLN